MDSEPMQAPSNLDNSLRDCGQNQEMVSSHSTIIIHPLFAYMLKGLKLTLYSAIPKNTRHLEKLVPFLMLILASYMSLDNSLDICVPQ